MRIGVPPPLSQLCCSVGLWAAPNPAPQFCFICAPVPALTESSLEEELNCVRGGMLVMPDLLFGVSSLGGTSPWGETCPS